MEYQLSRKSKEFKPFEVNLKIQSESDLIALMARLDVSVNFLKERVGHVYNIPIDSNKEFSQLWDELRLIAEEYRLYR